MIATEAMALARLDYRIEASPWHSMLYALEPHLDAPTLGSAVEYIEVALLLFLTSKYQKSTIARSALALATGRQTKVDPSCSTCIKELYLGVLHADRRGDE